MRLQAARFFALFFCAVALGPSLAHLLELPNKIGLSRDDYLVVQQVYRGWALLGIVIAGALLSLLALVFLSRGKREFVPALIALLCVAGTQVIFWTFTFPTNQQTSNWTMLPENWMALRTQWEYSHAGSALLNLIAMTSLIVAALRWDRR